jgi:two-component system, chemotaxis family, chemotaxis protein CheY
VKEVLVVDDEPGIAELVSWCLDPIGVRVVPADSLSNAIDALRSHDVGLILLDFDLGEEDGLDILPRLREEPRFAALPVVAFTAHDSRRREAFERGVVSFIARPFASAKLSETVDLLLTR